MCEETGIMIKDRIEYWQNKYFEEKEKNKKLEEELITESDIGYQCAKTDYDIFYISKDKIRKIIYPTPENPIELEIQNSKMYKELQELLEERN